MATNFTARRPMITAEHKQYGILLESTEDEPLGVLPHECIHIKEVCAVASLLLPRRLKLGRLCGV